MKVRKDDMRVRKSHDDHMKAARKLSDEVMQCVTSRLAKAGFESVYIRTVGSHTSWNVKFDGSPVASMNVIYGEKGADLSVVADNKFFTHKFTLHNTDSPRRVACLLMSWLRQAQIRQVMKA